MRRGFYICCASMLILIATLRVQQSAPLEGQIAVQGARPNAVLKPVSVEGGNWRHALASPTAPQIPWNSPFKTLEEVHGYVIQQLKGYDVRLPGAGSGD